MLRLAGPKSAPKDRARRWAVTVHHGGRTFVATREMADVFESRALELVSEGESGLVPLLHRDGIDMLLISPTMAFAIVPIEVAEPRKPAAVEPEPDTASLPLQAG